MFSQYYSLHREGMRSGTRTEWRFLKGALHNSAGTPDASVPDLIQNARHIRLLQSWFMHQLGLAVPYRLISLL